MLIRDLRQNTKHHDMKQCKQTMVQQRTPSLYKYYWLPKFLVLSFSRCLDALSQLLMMFKIE